MKLSDFHAGYETMLQKFLLGSLWLVCSRHTQTGSELYHMGSLGFD